VLGATKTRILGRKPNTNRIARRGSKRYRNDDKDSDDGDVVLEFGVSIRGW
jgi:hypothetical protein